MAQGLTVLGCCGAPHCLIRLAASFAQREVSFSRSTPPVEVRAVESPGAAEVCHSGVCARLFSGRAVGDCGAEDL